MNTEDILGLILRQDKKIRNLKTANYEQELEINGMERKIAVMNEAKEDSRRVKKIVLNPVETNNKETIEKLLEKLGEFKESNNKLRQFSKKLTEENEALREEMYKQAAINEELEKNTAEVRERVSCLAVNVWRKYFEKDKSNWEPLNPLNTTKELIGQISNMLAGLTLVRKEIPINHAK